MLLSVIGQILLLSVVSVDRITLREADGKKVRDYIDYLSFTKDEALRLSK